MIGSAARFGRAPVARKRPFEASVQSRFFLADLRDDFFSVVRFLEATFFPTFFFARELDFFDSIAAATCPRPLPAQP